MATAKKSTSAKRAAKKSPAKKPAAKPAAKRAPAKAKAAKKAAKPAAAKKGAKKPAARPAKAAKKAKVPAKAKKAAVKASARKAAPKKPAPKKAAAKKAAPKKVAPKKAAPKKAPPKQAAPKKAVPKKVAAKAETKKAAKPAASKNDKAARKGVKAAVDKVVKVVKDAAPRVAKAAAAARAAAQAAEAEAAAKKAAPTIAPAVAPVLKPAEQKGRIQTAPVPPAVKRGAIDSQLQSAFNYGLFAAINKTFGKAGQKVVQNASLRVLEYGFKRQWLPPRSKDPIRALNEFFGRLEAMGYAEKIHVGRRGDIYVCEVNGLMDWDAVHELRELHYPLLPVFTDEILKEFLSQYFDLIVSMEPVELLAEKRGLRIRFTTHPRAEKVAPQAAEKASRFSDYDLDE